MIHFVALALFLLLPASAFAQFAVQGNPFPTGRAQQADDGLKNARIYRSGNGVASQGGWEIRGDGSGPVIVDGNAYVPGAPGQRGKWASEYVSGSSPKPPETSAPVPSASEILRQVEEARRQKLEDSPPVETAPPPLQLKDLSKLSFIRILELADSDDASIRASALGSLPAAPLTTAARPLAVRRLIGALDETDLRIVAIAARALGELRAATATAKLIELLNLEDRDVLLAAVGALGSIGSARALPALASLSAAAEPDVAGVAAETAKRIQSSAKNP